MNFLAGSCKELKHLRMDVKKVFQRNLSGLAAARV